MERITFNWELKVISLKTFVRMAYEWAFYLFKSHFTLCFSPGESFSENFSHIENCQPCTRCMGLLRMQTPCTDSNNAICVCDYGYYLNELSNRCERCTKCPEGQGMLYGCDHDRDTVCEECTRDSYSDQESSREPCLPCTICDEIGRASCRERV